MRPQECDHALMLSDAELGPVMARVEGALLIACDSWVFDSISRLSASTGDQCPRHRGGHR